VPKVIDFGVAKAINQRLTERTLYTRFAQIIGTPMYMSPEQAELSGLDVDTRSDIYSLGVLLYELLTGTTPFDQERFEKAAYDEIRRIVREEEPLKPSTKISTLGETAAPISEKRNSTPQKLQQFVRGDLDWIVMKALEKDRSRRYEAASSLAADVERFLNDEPVDARPPSTSYRIRKFVRRNKGPVVAVSAVVVVLVAGIIGTSVTMMWAIREKEDAYDARGEAEIALKSLQGELLDKSLILAWSGDLDAATHTINKAVHYAGACESWIPTVRGCAYYYQGNMTQAVREFESGIAMEPRNLSARGMLAVAHLFSGRLDVHRQQLHELQKYPPREDYEAYDVTFAAYSRIYVDPEGAAKSLRRTLEPEERRYWAIGRFVLAEALGHAALDSGDYRDAKSALTEIRKLESVLGDNPFFVLVSHFIHMVAIPLAERRGEATDALQDRGEELLRRLETLDVPLGRGSVAVHYELFRRDHEQAKKAWAGFTDWDIIRHHFAGALYWHNEIEEALDMLERHSAQEGPLSQIASAYILADVPERRGEALATFSKLENHKSWYVRAEALSILFLLGEVEQAEELAHDVLQSFDGEEFRKKIVAHLAGEMEGEQLLQFAGLSRKKRSDAHFHIAMRLLGEGKRDASIRHFEYCINADQINRGSFYWAKAFLTRLKDEASWPDWIEAKPTSANADPSTSE